MPRPSPPSPSTSRSRAASRSRRPTSSTTSATTGRRALLNYGHTLAHALETTQADPGDGALRHGEAVAVGLAFAARLAERLGRVDDARVAEHDEVLEVFGLDGDAAARRPRRLGWSSSCGRDKKAHHDLTFVLDGPSASRWSSDIDDRDVVLATLRAMGAGQ